MWSKRDAVVPMPAALEPAIVGGAPPKPVTPVFVTVTMPTPEGGETAIPVPGTICVTAPTAAPPAAAPAVRTLPIAVSVDAPRLMRE